MTTTSAPAPDAGKKETKRGALSQELLIPLLAVLTGFILGAIVILISGENPLLAYGALLEGSLGNPLDLFGGIQNYFATGETKELLRAIFFGRNLCQAPLPRLAVVVNQHLRYMAPIRFFVSDMYRIAFKIIVESTLVQPKCRFLPLNVPHPGTKLEVGYGDQGSRAIIGKQS